MLRFILRLYKNRNFHVAFLNAGKRHNFISQRKITFFICDCVRGEISAKALWQQDDAKEKANFYCIIEFCS